MEKKKEGRKWEKFKINLQIQPFDFEISCSKYQKMPHLLNSYCLRVQQKKRRKKYLWSEDFSAFPFTLCVSSLQPKIKKMRVE